MYSTVEASLWCFEIVFWMIECWERVSIYNFYKKKIVWQFDIRSHVTQDLRDTPLFKDIRFVDLIKQKLQWCCLTVQMLQGTIKISTK